MSYDDDDDDVYDNFNNNEPQDDQDAPDETAGPAGLVGYDNVDQNDDDQDGDPAQDDQDNNWSQDGGYNDQDQDPAQSFDSDVVESGERYAGDDDYVGGADDSDSGAFDDQQEREDDDQSTAAHNYSVHVDVGLSAYDEDGESPANTRGMQGASYGGYPGAVVQSGANPYYHPPGGAQYVDPAPGYGGTANYGQANTTQPHGQQGGGWGGPPANSAQYYAQGPRGYPAPAVSAPVAPVKEPVNRISNASKKEDDEDDGKPAHESHGFVDGVLSQASTAIQTGIGKGIANSAAQATEGLIKMVGSSLHIGSKKPVVQPPVKPASTMASHNARPPTTGGGKPRPLPVHAAPIRMGTTVQPVPQSGGQSVATARPQTGTGKPPVGVVGPARVAQSGPSASPTAAHSSVPPAGARASAQGKPEGNVVAGEARRSDRTGAGGQKPVHTAISGDQTM